MLSTISRRMVFGAASALLVGLLVAAAPSGPPAAHLVSEKQMLLQASRTPSVRSMWLGSPLQCPPLRFSVAVGDIACPPGAEYADDHDLSSGHDGVLRCVAEAHLGAPTR